MHNTTGLLATNKKAIKYFKGTILFLETSRSHFKNSSNTSQIVIKYIITNQSTLKSQPTNLKKIIRKKDRIKHLPQADVT